MWFEALVGTVVAMWVFRDQTVILKQMAHACAPAAVPRHVSCKYQIFTLEQIKGSVIDTSAATKWLACCCYSRGHMLAITAYTVSCNATPGPVGMQDKLGGKFVCYNQI